MHETIYLAFEIYDLEKCTGCGCWCYSLNDGKCEECDAGSQED